MRPKEIKKLIELVEQSSISELEVTRFGRKVRISKNASGTVMTQPVSTTVASPPARESVQQVEKNTVNQQTEVKAEPEVKASENNIYELKSPMVGTFYRAPAPDADPYVEVGDIVSPNQVLCIIEAMKLMNEIECDVRGKIVDILAENGKPVEYGQVLFRIEKL